MSARDRRWARLLPDHRTLYISLEELDAHRKPDESDAELLLRTVHFAQRVSSDDHGASKLARDMLERAGLPRSDPLGLELALAMVVRSRFLEAHPHVLYVTVDESTEEPEQEAELDSTVAAPTRASPGPES